MGATQYLQVCTVDVVKITCWSLNHRMRKKLDLGVFKCRNVVGARQAGLSISEMADLLYFYAQSSLGFKENGPKKKKKEKTSIEQLLC